MKKLYKILYQIIKYPFLLLIFITPLKYWMKKYIKNYRSRGTDKLIDKFLNKIFWEEYFIRISEDQKNAIRDNSLQFGEGRLWAEQYYHKHFRNLENLRTQKTGTMSKSEAEPIYLEIISFLNKLNSSVRKNIYILQLGSSSGMDLVFFRNQFPECNYISTDINNEIINFQMEKHKFENFQFLKMYAQEIEKGIERFSLQKKKLIIFSVGSIQYCSKNEVEVFFKSLKNHTNLDMFILEPIQCDFIKNKDNLLTNHRADISHNHDYEKYLKKNNFKINDLRIISPYDKSFGFHFNTCHYYVHASKLE